MKISPEKSETMEFLVQDPVGCTTVVVNKCIQKATNVKYLGCEMSYEIEKDNKQKPARFAKMMGIKNSAFKPTLVQKFSKIKIHNILFLPILLYKSEIEPLENRIKKIDKIAMKFFRRTAGYTLLDHKRNEEMLEELQEEPVDQKLIR
jgi:hypothetical protein